MSALYMDPRVAVEACAGYQEDISANSRSGLDRDAMDYYAHGAHQAGSVSVVHAEANDDDR